MKSTGFTLIEVLVALGIVAIALVAGLQATSALTRNATRQSNVLLAPAFFASSYFARTPSPAVTTNMAMWSRCPPTGSMM